MIDGYLVHQRGNLIVVAACVIGNGISRHLVESGFWVKGCIDRWCRHLNHLWVIWLNSITFLVLLRSCCTLKQYIGRLNSRCRLKVCSIKYQKIVLVPKNLKRTWSFLRNQITYCGLLLSASINTALQTGRVSRYNTHNVIAICHQLDGYCFRNEKWPVYQ
jgi:hypothetical protein